MRIPTKDRTAEETKLSLKGFIRNYCVLVSITKYFSAGNRQSLYTIETKVISQFIFVRFNMSLESTQLVIKTRMIKLVEGI